MTRWKCLCVVAVLGCSETRDPAAPVDASTDRGGTITDAGVVAGDAPGGRVVINEVRATGDDWVELMNVGSAPVDLGGMVLADTDTDVDGGAPRVEEGVEFPASTWVVPGQRVLVLADQSDAGTGVQMRCLGTDGPMTCYHARFGISGSRGEGLFLIGRDHVVATSATYPPNGAPDGESWGRLPDGTGAFAANRPTPGAANAAP